MVTLPVKPPPHWLGTEYWTEHPVAAFAWLATTTARPVPTTSALARARPRRRRGPLAPRGGKNLMRLLLANLCHRCGSDAVAPSGPTRAVAVASDDQISAWFHWVNWPSSWHGSGPIATEAKHP